jgi:tetratricopeptide (TPR) repeat protein
MTNQKEMHNTEAMEGKRPDLGTLSLGDLMEVIKEYPWFGAARKELCARMSGIGGNDWGTVQYADAAMYIPSRKLIAEMVLAAPADGSAVRDAAAVIKEYIAPSAPAGSAMAAGTRTAAPAAASAGPAGVDPVRAAAAASGQVYRRTVVPVGGDFFSKEEYASVTRESDKVFSRFKAARSEADEEGKWKDPELGFCTETLGRIYAEQGYFDEAKKIYSRLMLRYPEKSAYFASLILKLDTEN